MAKQEEVDIFMNEYGMDIEPEYRALDVAAEFGEVAAEILAITEYGERQLRPNKNLEKEFGDLYFSLIALANKVGVDLDTALDQAMEKYKDRISETSSPSSQETQERQESVRQEGQQQKQETQRQAQQPDVLEADGMQPHGNDRQQDGDDASGETPWDVPDDELP